MKLAVVVVTVRATVLMTAIAVMVEIHIDKCWRRYANMQCSPAPGLDAAPGTGAGDSIGTAAPPPPSNTDGAPFFGLCNTWPMGTQWDIRVGDRDTGRCFAVGDNDRIVGDRDVGEPTPGDGDRDPERTLTDRPVLLVFAAFVGLAGTEPPRLGDFAVGDFAVGDFADPAATLAAARRPFGTGGGGPRPNSTLL